MLKLAYSDKSHCPAPRKLFQIPHFAAVSSLCAWKFHYQTSPTFPFVHDVHYRRHLHHLLGIHLMLCQIFPSISHEITKPRNAMSESRTVLISKRFINSLVKCIPQESQLNFLLQVKIFDIIDSACPPYRYSRQRSHPRHAKPS